MGFHDRSDWPQAALTARLRKCLRLRKPTRPTNPRAMGTIESGSGTAWLTMWRLTEPFASGPAGLKAFSE